MAADYRQVIRKVFDGVRNALRVIDTTDESLELVDTNQVTVSTTLIRIRSLFDNLRGDEVLATFQCTAGGPFVFNAPKTPTAGASEGSQRVQTDDVLVVRGFRDIERLMMIRATGGSDATVRANLYRRASR